MSTSWDTDGASNSHEWDLDSNVRRSFGRYELLTRLGSGGMANVYLARARGPGGFTKLAAVKCIHPHLAQDRSFVEMFLDEARIAAAIDHPNVCSAFDFGEVEGVYYLAMDYLAGASWSEVAAQLAAMREGEGPTDTPPPAVGERHAFVARIVADAAEGLHAAHEATGTDGKPLGVVHRDIALPNMFLRYDGQVQIVDFGCAKASGRIFQTEYGKVRGHIAYMAPEILRGWEADRTADIWSLGVALWELLAGERLFRRKAVHDTMFAIASEDVRPPSDVAPSVPPELDAIVLRALAREREQRYATAREMADDLERYVHASGHPMGLAELEAWMRRLFPGGRERVNRLLEGIGTQVEQPASTEPSSSTRTADARPEYPTVREKREPPSVAQEETRSLTDFTVASGIQSRRSWSPAWWPTRRVSPKTVALATVALFTLGLGPVMLGDSGPQGAASVSELSTQLTRGRREPVEASMPITLPSASDPVTADQPPTEPVPAPEEELAAVQIPAAAAHPVEERGAPSKARRSVGRINVLTPGGWADVMLGSRRLGPTPGQFTLPAGTHRLRIVSGDGATERWVTVEARPDTVERVVIDDL